MGIGDVLGKKDRLERHCMILSDGELGARQARPPKKWLT